MWSWKSYTHYFPCNYYLILNTYCFDLKDSIFPQRSRVPRQLDFPILFKNMCYKFSTPEVHSNTDNTYSLAVSNVKIITDDNKASQSDSSRWSDKQIEDRCLNPIIELSDHIDPYLGCCVVLFSICKQWINNSIIWLILFNVMLNKENDKSGFFLDRNRNL
jgi:hypothetical protein